MIVYGAALHWYRMAKLEYWKKKLYSVGGKWMNVYGALMEDTERGKLK